MLFACERTEDDLYTVNITFDGMSLDDFVSVFDHEEENVELETPVPSHTLEELQKHYNLAKYYEFYQHLCLGAIGSDRAVLFKPKGTDRYDFFLGKEGDHVEMRINYNLTHGGVKGTMTKKYETEEVRQSLRLLFLDAYNVRVE